MYLSTHDRHECCGCGSCRQVCAKKCITMAVMDDGFLYPVMDAETCVHCGKCVKVCPIHQAGKAVKEDQSHRCYYGWHKNASVRMQSTSGGAFSAISGLMLEQGGGTVYGAIYDPEWHVCHRGVNTVDGLAALRQSKYVQSDLGACYSEIEGRLSRNEKVLFCGTPCQVHGLRMFLGKDHESLWMVDFVCHGVTSPEFFRRYVNSLEGKEKSRIARFRFRDKVTSGNVSSLAHTTIQFENNRTKSSSNNIYLRAYMQGFMQRDCCGTCAYASAFRMSDVTLGDFWGIEEIIPELKDEMCKGISLVLGNTPKGHRICERLADCMCIVETDVTHALNGKNGQLLKPLQMGVRKRQFCHDANRMDIRWALLKGLGLRTLFLMQVRGCKDRLKGCLPKRMYGWLVSIKRGIPKQKLVQNMNAGLSVVMPFQESRAYKKGNK